MFLTKLLRMPVGGSVCLRRFVFTGPKLLNKKLNICLEGNIGSGKSTFLENFRQLDDLVEINEEPVQKWRQFKGHRPLTTMYEDPKRWCFTFQSFVMKTLKETHSIPQMKPLRLMERSLYSAMYCFVENQVKSGSLTTMEYAVLQEMFKFLTEKNQLNIDLIVYLKTSPEVCYKRILERNRKEEQSISMEYLEGLHELHEDWLIKGSKYKIRPLRLVIDGNQDRKGMEREFEQLLTSLTRDIEEQSVDWAKYHLHQRV